LATRITGLDTRLTADESELHTLAQAFAGNALQTESSLTAWLAIHVKDYVLDTALKQSKFQQIFEASNEWSSNWCMPIDYIVSLTSHSRGYRPDDIFVGHSTRAIRNRFVYSRFTFHPSGLTGIGSAFGLGAIPASDVLPCDMNLIYYNDCEHRGDSSIHIGMENSAQEGTFKVKKVTQYGAASSVFPDDPLTIDNSQLLFEVAHNTAAFHVHLDTPSLSVGGISVNPTASTSSYHAHHHANTDQHFHTHLTRKHRHVHNHVTGGEMNSYYTAPSRTVINRHTNHLIQSFTDFTTQHQTTKLYRSIRVVPSYIFTEFNLSTVSTISWGRVTGKPDFAALYATVGHNHDTSYATLAHNHDSDYAALAHHHDSDYAPLVHHHNYAAANHSHSQYVTSTSLATQIAGFVDYNSLGLLLNGYEQTDAAIVRHVSSTADWHTLRYYSNGQNQDFDVPTRAHFLSVKTLATQTAASYSLHSAHP
jgi:hypothetical protein